MIETQKEINLLFRNIITLDMLGHELEVARRIAADSARDYQHVQYYSAQIPVLETRVNEQYQMVWSRLQGIGDAESGIARIAVRSILKNCGMGRSE